MDEGSRLQGVVGPLVTEIVPGPLVQVLIDERGKLIQSRLIAFTPVHQQPGYIERHSVCIVAQDFDRFLITELSNTR